MCGRTESRSGPGKPLEGLTLGDLGGHKSPERDPGETGSDRELWPRARAVAHALRIAVKATPVLGTSEPGPDELWVGGCPCVVGDVDRSPLGNVRVWPAHPCRGGVGGHLTFWLDHFPSPFVGCCRFGFVGFADHDSACYREHRLAADATGDERFDDGR